MDEETAYKLTVGQMREKIAAECNKRIDCVGCPLYPESDEPCFAGDDETVKENYAIMFCESNGSKEGMKKVHDDATIKAMADKIKASCDKYDMCEGCPIFNEPGTDCYDTPAQIIKHYAMLFGDNNSAVDHPAHYCYSKYEPKDVIRGWGLNFNLGSAVKYIARAGRKDDIIQDLEKAKKFLEFEIEALKLDRENGSDV